MVYRGHEFYSLGAATKKAFSRVLARSDFESGKNEEKSFHRELNNQRRSHEEMKSVR